MSYENWKKPSALTANKVLVACDDDKTLRLTDMLLSADGHEIQAVASGEEALRHLKEHTPDLIILDLGAEPLDSLEICRRVKKVKRLMSVPVVVVTAINDHELSHAAKVSGADAVAHKPLVGKDFRVVVQKVLNSA